MPEIRDAAVMGYVPGTMAHGKEIPADSDVLALVIDCCLNFPDLYPAMKRARRGGCHPVSEGRQQ